MISEEEEKAIKNIKHVKEELNKDKQKMIDYGTYKLYEMFSNDLDTVLNLIEKQSKKIENLENLNKCQSKDIKKAVDYTFELNKEIDDKNNKIEHLKERIADLESQLFEAEEYLNN